LSNFRVEIDERSEYSPGYKFNDWEMKGVPLRIEIGPRDIKAGQVVAARRDNGKKENVKIKDIEKRAKKILEDIHMCLYDKAKKYLKDGILDAKNLDEAVKGIKNKKLIKANWCGNQNCEDWMKTKTEGAKIVCVSEEKAKGRCVYCKKPAKHIAYIAKSY
jgi:prolyl-tRNA synthetase